MPSSLISLWGNPARVGPVYAEQQEPIILIGLGGSIAILWGEEGDAYFAYGALVCKLNLGRGVVRKIQIWILICCPYSFPTEAVGRSW